MTRKLNPLEINQVCELAKRGKTITQLLTETHHCYSTIRSILKENHIPIRRDDSNYRWLSDEQIQEICVLFDAGASLTFIAKKFRISVVRTKKILIDHSLLVITPKLKADYVELDGERICLGMSYDDYVKKKYGKKWKKILSISRGQVNFDEINRKMDSYLTKE